MMAPHPVTSRHRASAATCDSLGAGDHFSGALLHALLNDLELAEAVHAAAVETAKWLERRRERNSA